MIQNQSFKSKFWFIVSLLPQQNCFVVYNCENEKQEMGKKAPSKSGWGRWRWWFCRNTSLIRFFPVTGGFKQYPVWTVIKSLSLAIKGTTESFQPIWAPNYGWRLSQSRVTFGVFEVNQELNTALHSTSLLLKLLFLESLLYRLPELTDFERHKDIFTCF